MENKNRMELADMEVDELSLSSVHGGFGWHPTKKIRPSFGPGASTGRPINVDIDFNITIIKIEGNMNIAGGQDVTLPG